MPRFPPLYLSITLIEKVTVTVVTMPSTREETGYDNLKIDVTLGVCRNFFGYVNSRTGYDKLFHGYDNFQRVGFGLWFGVMPIQPLPLLPSIFIVFDSKP